MKSYLILKMPFLVTFLITFVIVYTINLIGRRILIGKDNATPKKDFVIVLIQSLVISALFYFV